MRRQTVELVVVATLLAAAISARAAAPAANEGALRLPRTGAHKPHVAALLRDRAGQTLESIVILRPSAENELAAKVALFNWRGGASDLLVTSDLGGDLGGDRGRDASAPKTKAAARRSFTLSVDPGRGSFTFQRAPKGNVQSATVISPIDGGGDPFSGSIYNVNGYLNATTGRGYPAGGLSFYAEWSECPSGSMRPNIFYGDCYNNPDPGITGDIMALVGCQRDQPFASTDGSDLFIGRVTATYVGSRYYVFGTTALHETLQGEGYAQFGGIAFLRWSFSHSDPEYVWPQPVHYSESEAFPGGTYCPDAPGGGGGGGTGGGGTGGGGGDTGGGTGGGDDGGSSGSGSGSGGWGCATIYDGLTFEPLGVCCGTTVMIVDCAEGYL
jgi:hypothetical protein